MIPRFTIWPYGLQRGAIFGCVAQGAWGGVEVIEFTEYVSNPNAPTILVNKVVGVYRLQPTLVKCTFGLESPTAAGIMRTIEAASLVWTDAQAWLQEADVFRWVTAEVRKGVFDYAALDDGGGRRARHQ